MSQSKGIFLLWASPEEIIIFTANIAKYAGILQGEIPQAWDHVVPHLGDPGQEVLLGDGVQDGLQQDELARLAHPGVEDPSVRNLSQ